MLNDILLVIGALIIVAMLGYSLYLLNALRKQKLAFAQARTARINRLKESIEIIAKAMLNADCNLSEGVIRLKMLLDPIGQKTLNQYPAMWQLYQTVREMPTHNARKNLKKNERMRLDLTRESKEAELDEAIKAEIKQLLQDIM